MLPILSIPEVVKHYAPHFSSVFTAEELEHFKKYISGLIVSENKTIEAINRLFVLDIKHQSTLNRFLTASHYEVKQLNHQRLALMNQQTESKLKGLGAHGGVLGLDDTMLIHYGKKFDDISCLKDHSTDTYVWAHNLVNLHYSDDQIDYPTLFEIWKPMDVAQVQASLEAHGVKIKPKKIALKTDEPKKWKQHLTYLYKKHEANPKIAEAYRSKIVIGKTLLDDFYELYPLDIPVSFDKWFTCPHFCQYIDKTLKKSYVAGLKSNENVLLAGAKKITLADFVEKLTEEDLEAQQKELENKPTKKRKPLFLKTTIKYKGKKEIYYNYCKTHHVCGYGRQKLLISYRKPDLSDTARVFISNRLQWRVQHMTRVGRHRWPVEEYHKEGKAEGLDEYQTRNAVAIEKHIALVAVVYSILQHAQYDSVLLNRLQAQLNVNIEGSLAYWRRATQAQVLWIMVQWMDAAIKQGDSLQKIMEVLIPAYDLA